MNNPDIRSIVEICNVPEHVASSLYQAAGGNIDTAMGMYFDDPEAWNAKAPAYQSFEPKQPEQKPKGGFFSNVFGSKHKSEQAPSMTRSAPQPSKDSFSQAPAPKKKFGSLADHLDEDTSHQQWQGGAAKGQAGTVFDDEELDQSIVLTKYSNGYLVPEMNGHSEVFISKDSPQFEPFEKEVSNQRCPHIVMMRAGNAKQVVMKDLSEETFFVKRKPFEGAARSMEERKSRVEGHVRLPAAPANAAEGVTIKINPGGLTHTFDINDTVGHIFAVLRENGRNGTILRGRFNGEALTLAIQESSSALNNWFATGSRLALTEE